MEFSDFYGCGGMNRTYDLKVMSLASYHCSTPRYTGTMFLLERFWVSIRAFWLAPFEAPRAKNGANEWARTTDLGVMSPVL